LYNYNKSFKPKIILDLYTYTEIKKKEYEYIEYAAKADRTII
jgi:hypothetical protein